MITRAWRKLRNHWRVSTPSVAIALTIALVALLTPHGVQIQSGGTLAIRMSTVGADTGIVDYVGIAPKDDTGDLLGTAAPVYAVVNKSGTTERNGVVQVRLDLCLAPGAYRYDDARFYVIDESSAAYIAGYTGKVGKDGTAVDTADYDKWYEGLPRVWAAQRVFHSHFIYLDPYEYSDAAIQAAMAYHLPNFYAAWCADLDQVAHGMRHGWAVESRVKPPRYDDVQRIADSELVADSIAAVEFDSRGTVEGELFPATDIDVGAGATNRGATVDVTSLTTWRTVIDYNNPANDSGTIDYVEVYSNVAAAGNSARIGMFIDNGSASFTCRDGGDLGELTTQSKNTFSGLSVTVGEGDYIGMTGNNTKQITLERDSSGFAGYYRADGALCDVDDTATYSLGAGDALSLYGTGETVSVDITLDCSTYNFGMVAVGQTYNSTLNHFNLTNSGGVAVNVTIRGTDFVNATAGTANWTLADNATPSVHTVGLKAGLSGGDWNIIIRKSEAYNNLVTNLGAGNSTLWGIKLWAPTEINNGDPKRATITLTAAAA